MLPRRDDEQRQRRHRGPERGLDGPRVAERGVGEAADERKGRVRAEDQVPAALRGLLPDVDDQVAPPAARHCERGGRAAGAAVVVRARERRREEAEGAQQLAGAERGEHATVEDGGVEPGGARGREAVAEEGGEDRSGRGGRRRGRRSALLLLLLLLLLC